MPSPYKITVPRNERGTAHTARLNISVGQNYHEGDKFSSTVDWVVRHFNNTNVNICDALQRHNLQSSGIAPDQAFKMAVANGDAWIFRNQSALDRLPNLTITRWMDWINHPQWANANDTIIKQYQTDANFNKVANMTAQGFIARQSFNDDAAMQVALNYSLRYVLEEAAFALISSDDGIADIYPGTFPPIFDYMRGIGMPAPISMTTLSFKRRIPKVA